MLDIQNLSKTYSNGVKAINGISLQINPGMFGLLGPNGAGKSSLMRTIATLQLPDEGQIRFGDIDVLTQPHELRKVLGYLPQEFGLYPKVTAEELLTHLAVLKGLTDGKARKEWVDYLLQKTNLYDVRKKNLGTYSGGMKQRFGIAQALLGKPKFLKANCWYLSVRPCGRHSPGTTQPILFFSHGIEWVPHLGHPQFLPDHCCWGKSYSANLPRHQALIHCFYVSIEIHSPASSTSDFQNHTKARPDYVPIHHRGFPLKPDWFQP